MKLDLDHFGVELKKNKKKNTVKLLNDFPKSDNGFFNPYFPSALYRFLVCCLEQRGACANQPGNGATPAAELPPLLSLGEPV